MGYIRSLDIRDCWTLTEYWSEHPPVHVAVAAGLGAGYSIKERGPRRVTEEQRQFMSAGSAKPSSLPPVVAEALRRAAEEHRKPSRRT